MKNSKNYQLSKNVNVLQLQKELYVNRLLSLRVELDICSSYRDKLNDNSQGLLYLLTCINSLEETISNLTDVLKEVDEQLLSIEKEMCEKSEEIKGVLEDVEIDNSEIIGVLEDVEIDNSEIIGVLDNV